MTDINNGELITVDRMILENKYLTIACIKKADWDTWYCQITYQDLEKIPRDKFRYLSNNVEIFSCGGADFSYRDGTKLYLFCWGEDNEDDNSVFQIPDIYIHEIRNVLNELEEYLDTSQIEKNYDIVEALNNGGVETVTGCCEYNNWPSRIDLKDGRVLMIKNS